MLGPMKIQAHTPRSYSPPRLPKAEQPPVEQNPDLYGPSPEQLDATYRNYTLGGAAVMAVGAGLAAGMNGLHTGLIAAAAGAFVGAFFGNIYCHFTREDW